MAQLTIQQAFDQAVRHHQAGQLQEAEQIYRQVLVHQPQHADAIHLLGTIASQTGHNDVAVDLISRAIALNPDLPGAYNNLGMALKENGRLDESIAAFREAIARDPNLAEAYSNLGSVLKKKGLLDEAIAAYRQGIALNANHAEVFLDLGSLLDDKGQLDEAIAAYRQAIVLRPNYAEAYSNLGTALMGKEQLDEAIAAYRQAIELKPNFPEAHANIGYALSVRGQLDEAIAAYRQAITLKPDFSSVHSNLAFTLYYHPGYDGQAIAEEHRRWSQRHAEPLRKLIPAPSTSSGLAHANTRDPDRRLRIGYVSGDFRDHPVGRFLLPLLEHHDHRQFEVFCYSNVSRNDEVTQRIRACADGWRPIVGQTDDETAGLIRADGVDILVDLSGLTSSSRLLVFARKPAPVQVSYLGYPGTTGMSAIDYRLTDGFADPPGLTDRFYTEKLHRLPRTNWCFAAPKDAPAVQRPPALRRGYVTFGSFNNFTKATDAVLQAWGMILRQVSGSRLLLKSAALAMASARDRVAGIFTKLGIDVGRLDFRGVEADHAAHLALYSEMDIALDTFPYNGTTTTCEALWMGVPVITLAGSTHVSRVGLSLLSNIGLGETIATTTDEYISLAVALGEDRDRLNMLRLSLRERMRMSPLMDAEGFARDVEAAYRQMWRGWCETVSAE